MGDINATIIDFQNRKLKPMSDWWIVSIATPYSKAYRAAYDGYLDTMKKQANSDKIKIELALTALSLCSGSLMTAIFAGVALKAVAAKTALDFICRHNLNRLFKTAHFVDTNMTAKFIIGAVWDQAADMLTAETKRLFEQNPANFPCVNLLVQKPVEIRESLLDFITTSYLKVNDVCNNILESNKAASEKEAAFNMLVQSPFCNPPRKCPFPNDLPERIELTFYLKLVLSSDWLVTRDLNPAPDKGYPGITAHKKPISQVPGEKAYPKFTYKPGDKITTVEYDRIGQDIIKQMNRLYKILAKDEYRPIIDSRLFGEVTSEKILKKADQLLKKIGTESWKVNPL